MFKYPRICLSNALINASYYQQKFHSLNFLESDILLTLSGFFNKSVMEFYLINSHNLTFYYLHHQIDNFRFLLISIMEFQLSFLIEEFCCSLKCSFQALFRLQMINQNILEDSCYFNYLFLCKLVELNKKRGAFFCD